MWAQADRIQQIEQTSKGLKLMQVNGVLAAVAGALILGGNFSEDGLGGIASFGLLILILGVGMFAFARIAAWWYHG